MLHVFIGDRPDVIFNTAVYFKNSHQDSWIVKPLHLMDFGDGPFKIRVVNENVVVANMRDLVRVAAKYV